jgi:hypothetical protein
MMAERRATAAPDAGVGSASDAGMTPTPDGGAPACSNLAAAGTWENITPAAVGLPGPTDCPYGTNAFAVDPNDPATVYLGTCNQGIWKRTDRGATWAHVNTGNQRQRAWIKAGSGPSPSTPSIRK